jgi:methanogenic corrinoid protein MtbC1
VLKVARLAAEPKRSVFMFWKLGVVLEGTVEGDINRVGKEWLKVLVGGAQSADSGP